ncbi:hypothetical protein FJZ27_05160, partial [Candidatus Peribacteria bacterium]|nr:hypothetical protein [Candidatus Peribacteria bacterium]
MKTATLQAQYGRSTEHNLNREVELTVSPVREINETMLIVNAAIEKAIHAINLEIADRRNNIDEICATLRDLAERLHLPMDGADEMEDYLRSQWEASPDACIDALRAACVNRPESDIIIQSGREAATLGQGTHFIEAATDSERNERGLTIRNAKGDRKMSTPPGERLRARVTVGAGETVEVMASNAQLLIFSILHEPELSSIKIQPGDPPHARYLEVKDDKFLAGRHFSAEMMGDPSWHELRLLPNSNQRGFEHIHPHMRLVHVTAGKGTLQTGTTPDCADQPFELFPGKLIILTPGTWH